MEQAQLEWQKLIMEYGAYPWWMYPRPGAMYNPFVGLPGFPPPRNVDSKPQSQENDGEDPQLSQSGVSATEIPLHGGEDPTHVEQQTTIQSDRRPVQEKVRHKRQTLQDMSRPLKQWLYAHKDHPYPAKSDKVALARDSKMTLTQVSNWFANARRRLKNTVKGPDMGWEKRIRLYNSCVEGNQELLSISSQDSMWESEDGTEKDKEVKSMEVGDKPDDTSAPPPPLSPLQTERVCSVPPTVSAAPACDVNTTSPDISHSNHGHEQPSKFKHSILQRYLNDSYEHSLQVQNSNRTGSGEERHRNPSGSLSSHDYEDISVSSRSSPVREHLVLDELSDFEEISRQWPRIEDRAEEDLYWMEISAALALTTLAKSRHKPVSSPTE